MWQTVVTEVTVGSDSSDSRAPPKKYQKKI